MSTEDKTNEISAGAQDQYRATPPTDPETQQKDNGAAGTITLFFIIGLVASLVLGWVIFPQLLYSKKKQPIDFNHALHNELVEASCESCHFFRQDGTYSGVPTLAQCIDCHEEVQGESEEEEKFVSQYVAKGREVPWLVYARQPDCVFFSHIAHVFPNSKCNKRLIPPFSDSDFDIKSLLIDFKNYYITFLFSSTNIVFIHSFFLS